MDLMVRYSSAGSIHGHSRNHPTSARSSLREPGGQHHDRCCADHRADHSEPALAQRSPELRETDGRRGDARPKRVVELKLKRDEEGETYGSPRRMANRSRSRIAVSLSVKLVRNGIDETLMRIQLCFMLFGVRTESGDDPDVA